VPVHDGERDGEAAGFRRTDSVGGESSFYEVWGSGLSDPIESLNACVEVRIDAFRVWLSQTGRDMTEPRLDQIIGHVRQKLRSELEAKFRGYGVPANLVRLLRAGSKREAERIGGEITVTGYDLARLAFNAKMLGYRHRSKERRFMPAHLITAFDEVGDALAKEPRDSPRFMRALGVIPEMHRQRKHLFSHLFEKGAKWHCFFFDFRDWREHGDAPHIHYVDHHWGRPLTRELVWDALDKDRNALPRAVHIRFLELPTHGGPAPGGHFRTFSAADVLVPTGYRPREAPSKKKAT
jgi:hypothetical protein